MALNGNLFSPWWRIPSRKFRISTHQIHPWFKIPKEFQITKQVHFPADLQRAPHAAAIQMVVQLIEDIAQFLLRVLCRLQKHRLEVHRQTIPEI